MKKIRGFTLLELILVMAIMGVAVAIVLPRLSDNRLSILKTQVREALIILKHARQSAIIQAQEQRVLLYPAANEEEAAPPVKRPGRSQAGVWVSTNTDISWETPVPEQQEDGAYVLYFYPGGSASGATFMLAHQGFSAKIEIHPFTGKSTVTFLEPRP
jgi:general secretion pathway protein H